MVVSVRVDENNREATLVLTGRLTFDHYKAFAAAYQQLNGDYSSYVLDMGGLEYLDSSALGMLLRFKEELSNKGDKSIPLLVSEGIVSDVLRVSQFDKLFQIKAA